jgi:hypothetical protein
VSQSVPCREPQEFAAGDTLLFQRTLADFSPYDGWKLVYELRGGPAAGPKVEFQSTQDGAAHKIEVAAEVTAAWLPGEYIFAGYAVNGMQREQFFLATLTVTPDQVAAPADAPQKTFAQQMLEKLEAAMLEKAGDDTIESQIGDSRFRRMTMEQLRSEHGYWKMIRKNEIAIENARNGRPTGNKIRPVFNVMPSTGIGLGVLRPN